MDASPRIVMVANARIPSERAHPLQIMHMAAGFASGGATVLLAYARRANTEAMRSVTDPFKYAGVPRVFALVGLPTVDAIKRVTIDWPVLNHGPIRLVAHLLQLWSFAVAALTVVRRWKPHVVYSRDLLPLTVLRLLLGQPARFCFEVHTVPRSRLSALLHLWAARRMDVVVAITEGLRRWYLKAGFEPNRLYVAPDAVDIEAFADRDRGAARVAAGVPRDAPVVCYLGHLYPWKGVDTLVEAARRASTDVQWIIVGGIPPDLDRIMAAASDLPNVHVTGHLPPEEARQYLVAADVAVVPFSARQIISREHTSPLKLFEYMAAERPIVASDLPSLREVLHDERNALLVAPDDPNALAAAVTRLLADSALAARLAQAARLEVESRTWTQRAAAIREFLESYADFLTRLNGAWDRLLGGLEHASVGQRRALVAAGLLTPLLVLYRDLLFAGSAWLDLDLLLSYQPRYALLADGIREGRIPLWADGMLAGFPVAFSEFGWFYPLTWVLLRVFEPLRAYFIELALGLALAAAAAYWLGRVWGLSRLGAYMAAFLFTYGGFVFATSRFLNYADIFFALPAGVGAIELITRGQRRFSGLLALSAAVTVLAGHPQIALLWGFVWLLFAATRFWWIWGDSGLQRAVTGLAWVGAAAASGLAVGAVRLLPTITTTGLSARAGGLDFAVASQGSIPPWSLVLGYLYPAFEIPRVLNETLNAEELLYLGLAAPALALVAVVVGWRQRLVVFLSGLILLTWILSMGSFSLGFPLLHKLPLFEFFRQPARFGIAASFGLAYLVAIGIEHLRDADLRSRLLVRWIGRVWVWLAGLIGAGAVAATIVLTGFAFLIVPYAYDYIDRVIVGSEGRFLTAERYYRTFDQLYEQMTAAFSLEYWAPRWSLLAALLTALIFWRYLRDRVSPASAQAALVGVLVFDVLLAPFHGIPTVPNDWYAREPQAASVVPGDSGGEWRVFSYRSQAQKFELSTAAGTELDRTRRDLLEYVFLNETLAPNLPMTGGRASIDGYENLMPRATADYLAYVGSERSTVAGFASDSALDADSRAELLRRRVPALAAANVRFVTSGVPIAIPTLRQVQAEDLALPAWASVDQTLYIYQVQDWAPRAWIARDWRIVDAEAESPAVLEAIGGRTDRVLVDRDPGIPATATAGTAVVQPPERDGRRVTVRVELSEPGLLVLNEAMFPGWDATVDGRPTEMVTVNTLMRGVPIDSSGTHTVVMTYTPPGFAAGIVVSLAALGVLIVLAAAGIWVDRR